MSPELDAEDQKLVRLALSALPRSLGPVTAGAAIRDEIGRTYVAAAVDTGALRIGALSLAVATAVSSGARRFEAARPGAVS